MNPELQALSSNNANKTNWKALFQLVFSLMTFSLYAGLAILMAFLYANPKAAQGLQFTAPAPLLGMFFVLLGLALLALPAVIGAVCSLRNRPAPKWMRAPMRGLYAGFTVFIPVLLLGLLGGRLPDNGAMLQAWLIFPAITLPIFGLLRIGFGDLWGKHPQRDAGLLTFSTGFTIYVIMLLEVVIAVLAVIVLALVLANNAALQQFLEQITSGNLDLEGLSSQFELLLREPAITAAIFLVVALFLPIVEETLKTLGVWFLRSRKLSPAEGFSAGLISGAGFALVEGLLYALQAVGIASMDWFTFVIGRFAGSLFHVFAGGLLGWALAKTWQDRKKGRLFGIYLLVVLMHGAWNALALAAAGLAPRAGTNAGFLILQLIFFVLMAIGFLFVSRSIHRGEQNIDYNQE